MAALLLATYNTLLPWLRDDKVIPLCHRLIAGAAHVHANLLTAVSVWMQELVQLLKEHMGGQASAGLRCASNASRQSIMPTRQAPT